MGINLNNIGISRLNFLSSQPTVATRPLQTQPDSFVRESKEVFYAKRLEQLFPNGELQRTYDAMCEELELDYKPRLNLTLPVMGNAGGGYSFGTNTVTLSLEDTLGSDTKLYGIKNGEKELQIDKETGVPMMTSKLLAAYIAYSPEAAKNKGLDAIVAEPASDEEIKKLFIQKLYHELVHAKQHMIMRQTEGIGAKNVFKSWGQGKKAPTTPSVVVNLRQEEAYRKSFWAKNSTPVKYSKDSEIANYANKCLDAIKNYPPVDSPDYTKNFIEAEAFKESYNYIVENYGDWS